MRLFEAKLNIDTRYTAWSHSLINRKVYTLMSYSLTYMEEWYKRLYMQSLTRTYPIERERELHLHLITRPATYGVCHAHTHAYMHTHGLQTYTQSTQTVHDIVAA